jgi:hypothetical protein
MKRVLLATVAALAIGGFGSPTLADDCVTIDELVAWLHEPPTEVPEDLATKAILYGDEAREFAAFFGYNAPAKVGTVFIVGSSKWENSRGSLIGDAAGCLLKVNGDRADEPQQTAYGVFPTIAVEGLLRRMPGASTKDI